MKLLYICGTYIGTIKLLYITIDYWEFDTPMTLTKKIKWQETVQRQHQQTPGQGMSLESALRTFESFIKAH